MIIALAAPLLLLAQAETPAAGPPVPRSVADDRLTLCLDTARTDPASAIVEASSWANEVTGADRSHPQQCLGMAYTSLLRWTAAEQAFMAARELVEPSNAARRAELAVMAGNAALADQRGAAALVDLNLAAEDARTAGDTGIQALVEVDRSRAQVMLGDEVQAEATLARAREFDAQMPYAWLLSATLARRLGKLDEAQGFIETAARLSPGYPETGLEAGVIAMLDGRETAARESWNSVVQIAPDSEAAATAREYLTQIGAPPAGEVPGR